MGTDTAIGARIRRLRKQILGIESQAEFAQPLNVTRGAVGNWERGQGIKRDNLRAISDAYNVSFEWLATGKGEPTNGSLTTPLTKIEGIGLIPVIGAVEAGTLQRIDAWGADEVTEHVPSASGYPLEMQHAYVVHGESINRSAKDGDRLICLDLIASGVDIENGDLVIVERRLYGGQALERTAKRVRMTTRGPELWPESDHPDHQEAIAYEPNGDPDHNEVLIVAKVLWILSKP